MGKPSQAQQASAQTLISLQVRRDTHQRVADAAKQADQPMAAWVRIAIMEKLERDEART